MPAKKVKDYLDTHGIKYVSIQHSRAYTAQELAAAAHIPGKELAKTVIVMLGDAMAMAVLPATCVVDFELMREAARGREVRLATEDEFKYRFPDCEIGAMPPFGNLYGMETFVDDILAEDEEIAFTAGSHAELIRMSYDDYVGLTHPRVIRLSRKRS